MISILTISNLCLMIALMQVPHSYIIRLITGDLKIINNTSRREVFAKVPKYRQSKSINWKHNFKIHVDSIEDYARQRAKHKKEDLDTLSEWVKSVRSLIQIRIYNKNSVGLWALALHQSLKTQRLLKHLSLRHSKYVIVSDKKARHTIVFVFII